MKALVKFCKIKLDSLGVFAKFWKTSNLSSSKDREGFVDCVRLLITINFGAIFLMIFFLILIKQQTGVKNVQFSPFNYERLTM